MAASNDYNYTVLRVNGVNNKQLYYLANLYVEPMDPSEITSVIAELHHKPNFESNIIYENETWLTSMDKSKGNYLFAVSADGELHHNRNGKWEVIDLDCPDGLSEVWACSDDEIFAAGLDGERVHVVGKKNSVVRDDAKRRLSAIHGTSSTNVFAVGNEGFISRFNGKEWIELEPPTNHNLLSVFCVSENEVYIAGAEGILMKWNGSELEFIEVHDKITITSLAWYKDKLYAAAGKDGVHVLEPDGFEKIKEITLYRLRTIDNLLFGTGNQMIVQFDGSGWWGGNANL